MSEGTIDWEEIHRRLQEIDAEIEKGFTPSSEEKMRILGERAKILARTPEQAREGEYIEAVAFMLAQEPYGIETRFIREVYPLKDYTQVPCTPGFVLGLVNVRGRIVSVIDLRKFLDLPGKGVSDLNKVIIVHSSEMEFGVLADVILGVQNIAAGELQPSLPTLTGIREEFLKGVTSERMVILDGGKLLSDRNIIVHEEV